MERYDLINKLISEHGYKSYLEIGIMGGECWKKVKCENKTGVDPKPEYVDDDISEETSDSFFNRNSEKYDIIFVDGLHLEEQVARDIENAKEALNPNGVILVHDCLPTDEKCATDKQTSVWYGTVWKAAPKYVDHVLDIDTGIGVVYKDTPVKDVDVTFDTYRDALEIVPVNVPKKVYKVFIACPAYKWPVDPHMQASVQAAINHPGLDCEFNAVVGDAHIERARAVLLSNYAQSEKEFDYFLNVDWDIEFDPNDLYRACSRELDCVGGPYAFKTKDPGKDGQIVFRPAPEAKATEEHLLESLYLGGGFTMLSDKLVKHLYTEYDEEFGFNLNPDLNENRHRAIAVWNPIIIDRPDWGEGMRELLSEDYSLCERIRDLGYTCWVDLQIMLKHWDGDKCFELPRKEVTND